jgi:hypothetical protein
MANKNTRRRESKKPKKEEKQSASFRPVSTNPPVEVVRKGKTAKESQE